MFINRGKHGDKYHMKSIFRTYEFQTMTGFGLVEGSKSA